MGLYCERQGSRDAIQAMLSVGSLLGLIIMNVVSDLRGRRLALIVDLLIATLSALRTNIAYCSDPDRRLRPDSAPADLWLRAGRLLRVLAGDRKLHHRGGRVRVVAAAEEQPIYEPVLLAGADHLLLPLQLDQRVVQCHIPVHALPLPRAVHSLLHARSVVSQLPPLQETQQEEVHRSAHCYRVP